MRVGRQKLIFFALAILTRWSSKAAEGPVEPDLSVRFALAFLFACGKSGERRLHDEFWKWLSYPGRDGKAPSQNNYVRRLYCDSCIKGIILDVGAPLTPEFFLAVSHAARRPKTDDQP